MTLGRRALLQGFASTLAGATGARAQPPSRVPRVGILNPGPAPGSPGVPAPRVLPAFLDGLRDLGWIDGRTVHIEGRHAGFRLDRLPELATDLVRLGVDVIVVAGPAPMRAAGEATRTIFREMMSGLARAVWLWDARPDEYQGSRAAERQAAALDRVRAVAERALAGQWVDLYLFGSWARGTAGPASDVDLAVDPREPLPPGALARQREALEESTIPLRVDVVDLADTDAAFRDRVRREGIRWIACANA